MVKIKRITVEQFVALRELGAEVGYGSGGHSGPVTTNTWAYLSYGAKAISEESLTRMECYVRIDSDG